MLMPGQYLMMMRISLIFLILTAALFAPRSQAQDLLEHRFSWHCHPKDVGKRTPATVREAQFIDLDQAVNLFYQTDKTCWVKLRVSNPSLATQRYYLEHRYPLTSELVLFEGADAIERLGFTLNSLERRVAFANPTFPLDITPGTHEYLLRIESMDIMRLDFALWTEPNFFKYVQKFYGINCGFIALCLGLGLYNFMQFLGTRRPSYGFYVLFLIHYAGTHMFLTGMLKQFFLPGTGYLNLHGGFYFVQAMSVFAQLFVYHYLELKNTLPRFARTVFLSLVPLGISFFFNVTAAYSQTGLWNMISLACGAVLILMLGTRLVLMRSRVGYFFMAAWGTLLSSLFIYLGHLMGHLPSHILIENAYVVGASLEMIILSFALADQVREVQLKVIREKEHAFGQLKKMVYPHQLEQIKQGASLEDTMPCKGEEAAVICFDIVNSSKIKHPQAKEFFSRVFDRCHLIMERNYQFRPLTAQAFRLKEMGDGFLCSIGFPFHCPENREPAPLAVRLAEEFIQIFDEEAESLGYHQTLQASVGIAMGYVEGFFTLSGTRHYELFGKGIILATRYESVRKSVDIMRNGHLIVIQNRIYEQLTSEQQATFTPYAIKQGSFSIRDDPGAEVFFYHSIEARNKRLRAA